VHKAFPVTHRQGLQLKVNVAVGVFAQRDLVDLPATMISTWSENAKEQQRQAICESQEPFQQLE
jgi:hypothetical protein